MKRSLLVILGVIAAVGIGSAVYVHASSPPTIEITTSPNGLASLKSDGVELLQSGDFHVEEVLIKRPNGETYFGATYGRSAMNAQSKTLTTTYPWGQIQTTYLAVKNRLTITMETTNTSSTDTIVGIHYTPLVFKFPGKVEEYDGSIPLLEHNLGKVAVTKISYGSGSMAIVAEDVAKPLMVGLPWALDKPADTVFPLDVHTNRVNSYPNSYPTLVRPIGPQSKDECSVSLRFGRSKATEASLAGDIDKKFAQSFPQQLHWNDRRPIGAIFLATGPHDWPNNPRGWFGDDHLDIRTPKGLEDFKQHLYNLADTSIGVMKEMNAQGAITWDLEGQQFRQATTYIGDPRLVDSLAPEMAPVIDGYFGRFKAAGLRVGICVRPQLLKVSEDKKHAEQTSVDDPADLMIKKIDYAKKRWGVTLIYIDSNVNTNDPNPLDVSIIQKIAETFPDCLLIPEHSNLRYYAYSAPFEELRRGTTSTPEEAREIYPKAFSVIYTADGPLDLDKNPLKAAVKEGDSLMYRTWFVDPQNQKVKAIYQ